MSDDPQDQAEALDEDRMIDDDRLDSDAGEVLAEYPPDRPLGVGTVGVTPVEEDAGESFAERSWREEPDVQPEGPLDLDETERDAVGQLVDDAATSIDDEEQQIADAEPRTGGMAPEEAAMHIEEG